MHGTGGGHWTLESTSTPAALSESFRHQTPMPIPNADQAIAASEKVRDYLLNLAHPDGGPKAVWFHSLGYARDQWQLLAGDLLAIARGCGEFDTETTRFGIKYKAAGWIGRPGHRPAKVRTVWIVEDNAPPRLVTAYPDEEQ